MSSLPGMCFVVGGFLVMVIVLVFAFLVLSFVASFVK